MKITACTVCKRTIISFVIFICLLISGCYYLTQPVDASSNIDRDSQIYYPPSSNLSLTESRDTLYISNADNPDFAGGNYICLPERCPGLISDSTAGAAFVFETCVLEASGIISDTHETSTGKVAFNETNKK